jgi:DNA-binding GntR family transcriptional regulator
VYFSLSQNADTFLEFADLRTHIETSYWYEAVGLLNSEDYQQLRLIIQHAKEKLSSNPPQIPHQEHRQLHLTIFKRLENPFVQGLLEAYWEVYEAVGLDVYTDFAYLERVWHYHEKMVDAICKQNFNEGYDALVEHMDLIYQRSKRPSYQTFE